MMSLKLCRFAGASFAGGGSSGQLPPPGNQSDWRLPTTQHCRLGLQSSNDIDQMNTCIALLLSPQISFSSVDLSHCLVTISAPLICLQWWRFINLFTYLKVHYFCIISIQKPEKIFWGGDTAPSPDSTPTGEVDTTPLGAFGTSIPCLWRCLNTFGVSAPPP